MKISELYHLYNDENFPSFMEIDIKDPNQQGLFGETLLSIAISRENLEEVQALLDAGANINSKSENGNTPLHEAVGRRNSEIVIALLNRGADPSLLNDFNQNCFDVADVVNFNLRDL